MTFILGIIELLISTKQREEVVVQIEGKQTARNCFDNKVKQKDDSR
jgi:hypothetical protein